MASLFDRFARSVAAAPEETYVVWTSREDATRNSASYDAGQIVLTNWCEWLDANSHRSEADTLRWFNRGGAKGITLPATDPAYWHRMSVIHTTRVPKRRQGREKAAEQGDDPF